MDRLDDYRNVIRGILQEYDQLNKKADSTVESALIFDETRGHYLLVLMGWNGDERVKNSMIHMRIKGDKIWIEEDWTEEGVATDLLRQGIDREEIVLAFHPPQVRQYTEFSAA